MNLRSAQAHFVRVVVVCFDDAAQNFLQLGFVVNETQKRFTTSALCANTKNIFCGRIQAYDQEVLVEQDDACAQAVENASGVLIEIPVVAGIF